MALGAGYMEAIDEIKTKNALRGLSLGIVLAAARENGSFIFDQFVHPSITTDFNQDFPDRRTAFRNAYLWGLVHGREYAKKLTRRESLLLFKHLDELPVSLHPPGAFYMARRDKSDVQRRDYYSVCAAKFQRECGSE